MNLTNYLNKRVVLTCKNNLSYAGKFKKILAPFDNGDYVIVELDESSGFSILTPTDFIDKILEVPINENEES